MDGLYEQIRIALHQVWQRRWLAMAVAWGVCLIGWLVVALIPNSYESKARVFVQARSILPNQIGITPEERANELMRVKQTLTSAENLARVVRRTDLNNHIANERDLAGQVAGLREKIQIVAQPDNLIEIKATASFASLSDAENARTSAAIVQGLLDLFVEGKLTGDRQETGQSLTFLDQELRQREAALAEAQQRRVAFEQQFFGVLPGDGPIAQRISAAQAEINNLDQQIVAANASLAAMRSQLASTPPTLPGVEVAGGQPTTVAGQIGQLEGQISQALARGWTEQHPDIVALRQQVARLRPQARAETRAPSAASIPNPSYISLRTMAAEREAQLMAAQQRRAQIQSDLSRVTARQTSAPGLAAEQERLNRDYENQKQQYDRLVANRDQVRLRSDVQDQTSVLNVQVVEPPSAPTVPTAPNRPLLLTAVLVVALGAGLAAAFVMGQIQTTFPTQNRLAAITGLPVLGTITEVVGAAERGRRRRKLAMLASSGAALGGIYALLLAVEFYQRSTVA